MLNLSKRKILLTTFNARYTHSCLALYYLKDVIPLDKYSYQLEEFTINQDLYSVIRQIYKIKPDIIALSVYVWNTDMVSRLLHEVKKILPDLIIIVGGPEIETNYISWELSNPEINHFVVNGAEKAFQELLEGDLKSCERIIRTSGYSINSLEFPYNDINLASFKNQYIYYETTRGCPYRCSYCLASVNEKELQFRDLEKVLRELDYFIEKETTIVKFVDRTFNIDKKRYRRIWEHLIIKNKITKFHFEIRADLLDDDDFKLLAEVPENYFQFEIGIQSINEETLTAINRHQGNESNYANISRLIKLGTIHIHLDLIAGLPLETLKSFYNSFNYVYDLHPHQIQLGFLKILSGTKINLEKNKNGIVHFSHPPYRIMQNNWMSFDDLWLLDTIEDLLEKFYNSGRFNTTLHYLTAQYSSSFSLYSEMAKNSEKIKEISDWRKLAEYLIEFSEEKKMDTLLLKDFLKWDWCQTSSVSVYPEIIATEEDEMLRKTFYPLIKKRVLNSKRYEILVSNLKRIIIFKAVSDKWYWQGRNFKGIYIFVPASEGKIIMEIDSTQSNILLE